MKTASKALSQEAQRGQHRAAEPDLGYSHRLFGILLIRIHLCRWAVTNLAAHEPAKVSHFNSPFAYFGELSSLRCRRCLL